jgi:hypothetical protein
LAAQLGRPLHGSGRIAARCHLGLPVVIRTEPVFEDGRPFPTLYYLTCPLARARVSRLEAAGWVRELTARVEEDPAFGAEFAAAQAAYREERAQLLPQESPVRDKLRGGVGGSAGGVKCVHAHYAHHAAGRCNPVGRLAAERVEPLDCDAPCVLEGARNPAWREPKSEDGLDPGPSGGLS